MSEELKLFTKSEKLIIGRARETVSAVTSVDCLPPVCNVIL